MKSVFVLLFLISITACAQEPIYYLEPWTLKCNITDVTGSTFDTPCPAEESAMVQKGSIAAYIEATCHNTMPSVSKYLSAARAVSAYCSRPVDLQRYCIERLDCDYLRRSTRRWYNSGPTHNTDFKLRILDYAL